jgi:hypothetical protein
MATWHICQPSPGIATRLESLLGAGLNIRRVILILALSLTGCGIPDWWLGAQQGVLFQGFDALVLPGEKATVRLSLRGGRSLGGLSDYTVLLYSDNGHLLSATKTDVDGQACFTVAPGHTGINIYRAELDENEVGSFDVPTAVVQVGVYDAQRRFLIIDLDGTLLPGFDVALLGDPEPLPHATAVLAALPPEYQPLYLTGRPELLGRRSRQWLIKHKLPPGLLMLSHDGGGAEAFKTRMIRQIRQDFPQKHAGVGDKASDMKAYAANDLTPVLIVQTEGLSRPDAWQLTKELETLPAQTQVVCDWLQIKQVLTGQEEFPVAAALQRLRQGAASLPADPDQAGGDSADGECRP